MTKTQQPWLLPAGGEARRDIVADVALLMPIHRLVSYAVPPALREAVSPGALLRVPLRRRGKTVRGFCVRVSEREWDHARPAVLEVLQPGPLLTPALAELGLRIAEYYGCAPGRVFAAMIPAGARRGRIGTRVIVRATGMVPQRPSETRNRVLAALANGPVERRALRAAGTASAGVLRAMQRCGLIELIEEARPATAYAFQRSAPQAAADEPGEVAPVHTVSSVEDGFTLNAGQSEALRILADEVGSGGFRVNVLFGVPGSGKTEVYVRAIRAALARGGQAVLLVPEIMLATQIVQRLARRFERVAILHSRQATTARLHTLRAIASGEVDVVIGTRSAIFAPLERLRLIVVDEEQETSFKSLATPLYHARDVAIMRAQIERIPVVLGSATPALETWLNVQHLPHYRLLRLPERAPGAAMPTVRLLTSSGAAAARGMGSVLSAELLALLKRTIADGHQAILLHNRRGFAAHLKCAHCGLLICCERCGTHMVLHRAAGLVKCHRCGAKRAAPGHCLDESCGGRLEAVGLGIQRVEEELRQAATGVRLLRLDRDTLRKRADYQAALQQFENGAADVLLGTQIVAKGLDFPRVRLVGMIDADAALRIPDFRAAERVMQLIVQVIGRAGRREGASLAVVQSDDARSALLQQAARLDYEGFAAAELAARRQHFLPPFSRLARLVLQDDRPGHARQAAEMVATGLQRLAATIHPEMRVDDATPCVVRQLRGLTRWQLLARGPRDGSLQRLLERGRRERVLPPRVRKFTLDVDPVELL